MPPTSTTVKRLCTLSNNRCAFHGCTLALVDDESGTITGDICHIKARGKGGPRYDPAQTDEERDSFGNLMLMCKPHHKIVDDHPATYTVDLLQEMKAMHNAAGNVEVRPIDAARALLLLQDYTIHAHGGVTIGTIHAANVTIKSPRRTRISLTPPPDVVGGSSQHRRYLSHLIERYQDFASKQPGRNFRHPAIHGAIKGKFGTTWEWVPLSRFNEFCAFIQAKIDGTMLGKSNKSRKIPNYSTFANYGEKYQATRSESGPAA